MGKELEGEIVKFNYRGINNNLISYRMQIHRVFKDRFEGHSLYSLAHGNITLYFNRVIGNFEILSRKNVML